MAVSALRPSQVKAWALHDAMPEHLRVAVLLGACAGLRVTEVSGLRVVDVDFIGGVCTRSSSGHTSH